MDTFSGQFTRGFHVEAQRVCSEGKREKVNLLNLENILRGPYSRTFTSVHRLHLAIAAKNAFISGDYKTFTEGSVRMRGHYKSLTPTSLDG